MANTSDLFKDLREAACETSGPFERRRGLREDYRPRECYFVVDGSHGAWVPPRSRKARRTPRENRPGCRALPREELMQKALARREEVRGEPDRLGVFIGDALEAAVLTAVDRGLGIGEDEGRVRCDDEL